MHFPRGFKIDEVEELYGHVKGWSRHILCATGKTDWVRDVSDEKGSIMEAVGKHSGLHDKGVSAQHLGGILGVNADTACEEIDAVRFKYSCARES